MSCTFAYRTPICEARGGFEDTYPEDLLSVVLKSGVGTVIGPASQHANECKMAAFYAGIPAAADVAVAIKAGFYDIGIGNSTQVSDEAGAVLLMKRSVAMQKGLPIFGVFRSSAAVGVDPAVMGVGPAVAIPAAAKSADLAIEDIDLFQLNEVSHFL
ncbi:hypothetical protein ACP4OV_029084 [Aristida adscensionis]